MHIADIFSRLAGKDLEPPDKIIPISFNVMQTHSRSRKLLHPEKLPMADKHKPSQIGYIPASQSTETTKGRIKERQIRSITPRVSPSVITPPKTSQPLRNTGKFSKPLTQFQPPPLPVSLVRQPTLANISPPVGSTNKTNQKSLINPSLKIPQTLPPLDLPTPNKETIETFHSPDETLFQSPSQY